MSGAAPIAWAEARRAVTHACFAPAGLARALGAMGLYRRGAVRRGDVPIFAPPYLAFTPWRARMLGSRTEAGRGFAQGAWPDVVLAERDAADALERARIAEHNRALRDREVFVLRAAALDDVRRERDGLREAIEGWRGDLRQRLTPALKRTSILPRLAAVPDAGGSTLFLDVYSLDWMDATGAAHGEDIPSLAAWAWSCGIGRATARLARLMGVELWTVPELDRRVAAVEAVAAASARAAATAAKQEAMADAGA